MPGVIQRLRLELDQSSVKQLTEGLRSSAAGVADWIQGELEKVQGDEAGKKAGKALIAGLQQGFGSDLDALRLRFQRGLLNAEEFQTQGVAAAKRFNEGIRTELQRFAANPAFVVNPFKNIATAIDPGDVDRLESSASAAGRGIGDKLGQSTVDAATRAADFRGIADAARAGGTEAGEQLARGVKDSRAPAEATAKGVESARAWVQAITEETRRTEGQVKIAQAQGLLSQDEAHRKGQEAAHAHNQGILRGIAEFRGKGELNPQVLGIFTDAFQGLGDKVPPPTFFDRVGHSLRSHLASWSATIVSFFAARQLFRFGEDAVRVFLVDDKALEGLQTQVEATGARYETFAGQIEAVQDRLMRLGAASAGQVAQGIGQLIAVSGDADKSVRNIGLAADFAAKHHLTFEQSVELVGRAMIGQTRELRQYGIFVKAGDDAVVAMAKDAEGFASRQGPNLTRSVNMLSFAWHDLKASIGEALVAAGGGTSTLDLLTVAIRDGVTWVRSHREEIGRWGAALVTFARFLFTYVVTPIVRGFTTIIESFQDVGLTLEGLGFRFKFIGGAFAIIAANISDAWDGVLKKLGLWSPDAVADQTVARLRAWGERVQAEAVRQKEEIDKKQAVLRGEAPAEPTGPLPLGHRAAPVTAPSGIGGAVHPAGFGQGGAGSKPKTDADAEEAKRLQILERAAGFERTRAEALRLLTDAEAMLRAELTRTDLLLPRRVELEGRLAQVQEARAKAEAATLPTNEQIAQLVALTGLEDKRGFALGELRRIEAQLTDEMKNSMPTIARRIEIERQLGDVRAALPKPPTDFGKMPEVDTSGFAANAKDIGDQLQEQFGAGLKSNVEGFQSFFGDITDFASGAADEVGNRYDDLFARLAEGGMTVKEALGGMFGGLAQGLAAETAKLAKIEARTALANSIKQTAAGLAALAGFSPGKAAAHFLAAGKFLLEAAAWSALGGAAGNAAGGGGAGGGTGGGGGGGDEHRAKDAQEPGRIIVKGGPLDPKNEQQQDALRNAIKDFGTRAVTVMQEREASSLRIIAGSAARVAGQQAATGVAGLLAPTGAPSVTSVAPALVAPSFGGPAAAPNRAAEMQDPLAAGRREKRVVELRGSGIIDLNNHEHIDLLAAALGQVADLDIVTKRGR